MKPRRICGFSLFIVLMVGLLNKPAYGYVGPGAGLSAIGAFLAAVLAIILAIFGFIWYPVKRLIKKLKKSRKVSNEEKA